MTPSSTEYASSTMMGRLRRDERGVTAVEFALVSTIFFLVMFAVFEFGMFNYTQVAVEAALQQTARTATIGDDGATQGYATRADYIVATMKNKLAGMPNSAFVTVTSNKVTKAGVGATTPQDICIDPANSSANPYPAQCSCSGCMVMNNDGVCNTPNCYNGPSNDVGLSGELVEIRATFGWKILFPGMGALLRSPNSPEYPNPDEQENFRVISSSVVIKNEPFGGAPN